MCRFFPRKNLGMVKAANNDAAPVARDGYGYFENSSAENV
jgi:hypothetical protein